MANIQSQLPLIKSDRFDKFQEGKESRGGPAEALRPGLDYDSQHPQPRNTAGHAGSRSPAADRETRWGSYERLHGDIIIKLTSGGRHSARPPLWAPRPWVILSRGDGGQAGRPFLPSRLPPRPTCSAIQPIQEGGEGNTPPANHAKSHPPRRSLPGSPPRLALPVGLHSNRGRSRRRCGALCVPGCAMAEVEETLKRIQAHKGVIGTIVVNAEGIPIRTTLDNSTTVQYAGLLHQLTMKAKSTVRDIDPQNDLTFLRIRSKKHEIMVAPDKEYLLIVIQNPCE
ncbi:dynein light chain roadblock-type 2 [Hemicordylus capensis]|nr:dynein light chain roadblock-type 2 [Hemicordylus capensis]